MFEVIETTVNKFGWSVIETEPNIFSLFNRNGIECGYVSGCEEKYSIYRKDKVKLLTGKGKLSSSIEKVLTKFYYATPEKS